MEFKVNCPDCSQRVSLDEEYDGTTINCPICNKSFVAINGNKPAKTTIEVTTREEKACPFCSEMILATAKKCKHCSEFLDPGADPKNPNNCRQQILSNAEVNPETESKPLPLPVLPVTEFEKPMLVTNENPVAEAGVEEEVVWHGNPSHLYYIGSYLLAALFIIIGIAVYISFPDWESRLTVASAIIVFLGFGTVLVTVIRRKANEYIVTNQKVITNIGILSKLRKEIRIKDIRSCNIRQSFVERIFALGSLDIGTASTDQLEIAFSCVKNVQKVNSVIDEFRLYS